MDELKRQVGLPFCSGDSPYGSFDTIAAIKRVLDERSLDMEVIVNPKTLEGGTNVIQLETAVGAAMKCFENGLGIKVSKNHT